jgi:hypothetical protein
MGRVRGREPRAKLHAAAGRETGPERMSISDLESIVGPINRGQLESGFAEDTKRTIVDKTVTIKVPAPEITEDLSRFYGNPKMQSQARRYWDGMSEHEREAMREVMAAKAKKGKHWRKRV